MTTLITSYNAAGPHDFSYGVHPGDTYNVDHDGQHDHRRHHFYQSDLACTYASSTLSLIARWRFRQTASHPSDDYILQCDGSTMGDGYLTVAYSSVSTLALDTSLLTDGDGVGTPSYQWYADGTAIAGATASSYTPEANNLSLIGTTYSVEISQTDSMGTTETIMSASSDALTLNPAGDLDGDTITNDVDTDVDGDGYHTTDQGDGLVDAFLLDEHAWGDNDGDGMADVLHSSLTTTTTPVVTCVTSRTRPEPEVRPAPSPSRQA